MHEKGSSSPLMQDYIRSEKTFAPQTKAITCSQKYALQLRLRATWVKAHPHVLTSKYSGVKKNRGDQSLKGEITTCVEKTRENWTNFSSVLWLLFFNSVVVV